jgi:hypothetical protein
VPCQAIYSTDLLKPLCFFEITQNLNNNRKIIYPIKEKRQRQKIAHQKYKKLKKIKNSY